jgi:TRAP-type C4-dicarboxylate transport system substrate-binding protein
MVLLSLMTIVSVSVFFIGVFQNPAIASEEKSIKWRLSDCAPVVSLIHKHVENMAIDVRNRTNGKFNITVYPAGALFNTFENFDAVAKGAVEMICSCGWYHGGKMPEAMVEAGLPMSYTGPGFTMQGSDRAYEFFYDFKGGEFMKILRQAYDEKGVYLVAPMATGCYTFLTKFPVKTLDDFKGKKIRAVGLWSKLVQNMGAAPVTIEPGEAYLALQRGTVDGIIYLVFSLDVYKYKEVVNYVIVPPPMATALDAFYVNKKAWEALPADMKKILTDCAKENARHYTEASLKEELDTLKNAEKSGVKVNKLSDAEMEKLLGMALPIWDEFAKKSERTGKLVELVKEFYKVKKVAP